MSEEQLLKILLIKAIENGYEDTEQYLNILNCGGIAFQLTCEVEGYKTKSINDLVLNFEPNEIDFVEALFTALINEVEDVSEVRETYTGQFKLQFISLPTKDRLDYLFQTFNELLK